MTKDDHAYFLQRAAEEMAAAERATCPDAASVHRELALRYALRLILPDPACEAEEMREIGLPKVVPQRRVSVPPRRRPAKRNRG